MVERVSVPENQVKPVKLVWPGHLKMGIDRQVEEELETLRIEPGDQNSRYCRVSPRRLYLNTFFLKNRKPKTTLKLNFRPLLRVVSKPQEILGPEPMLKSK